MTNDGVWYAVYAYIHIHTHYYTNYIFILSYLICGLVQKLGILPIASFRWMATNHLIWGYPVSRQTICFLCIFGALRSLCYCLYWASSIFGHTHLRCLALEMMCTFQSGLADPGIFNSRNSALGSDILYAEASRNIHAYKYKYP